MPRAHIYGFAELLFPGFKRLILPRIDQIKTDLVKICLRDSEGGSRFCHGVQPTEAL